MLTRREHDEKSERARRWERRKKVDAERRTEEYLRRTGRERKEQPSQAPDEVQSIPAPQRIAVALPFNRDGHAVAWDGEAEEAGWAFVAWLRGDRGSALYLNGEEVCQ